jgi:hypothetical protein
VVEGRVYLGQIAKAGYGKLDISEHNEHLKKALDALLAHRPVSDGGL